MKLKDLKLLPKRKWNEEKIYDSLYVIPSGKKHDSGYALIYIIGVVNGDAIEIAGSCDDINWSKRSDFEFDLRNDMYFPSGIIRFWSRKHRFLVGPSLSSTDITLIK